MEIARSTIAVKDEHSVINVFFLGDTHIGHSCANERAIMHAIDIIKRNKEQNQYTYTILMGDMCDYITHTGDKRFDPGAVASYFKIKDLRNLPQAEADRFLGFIEPIKETIIATLSGNHEEKFVKYNTFDVYKYINDNIGPHVFALNEFGMLKMFINMGGGGNKRVPVDFALRHGDGGGMGKTVGYPINRCIDTFDGHSADYMIMAHIHKMTCQGADYIILNNKGTGTLTRTRWYGVIGCFLDSYVDGETNYHEAKGGRPVVKGMLKATIKFNRVYRDGRRFMDKNFILEEIRIK